MHDTRRAQCHGDGGEGVIPKSISDKSKNPDPKFQNVKNFENSIFPKVDAGHPRDVPTASGRSETCLPRLRARFCFAQHGCFRFFKILDILEFLCFTKRKKVLLQRKSYTKSMVRIQHPKILTWSRKFPGESRRRTLSDLLSCSLRIF